MKHLFKVLGLLLLLVLFTACGRSESNYYTVNLPTTERGIVTCEQTTVKEGESVTINVSANQHFTLVSFKANGTELEVVDGKVVITNVKEDLNIEVEFIGVEVEVSFSGASFDPITVHYDDSYGTLPSPTPQEGYEFVGWYTEESGNGSLITEDVVVTNAIAHTLYAHFTPKSYSVTLDPKGGEVGDSTIDVTFTSKYGKLPVATKEGFVFLYWLDENNEVVTEESVYNFTKNTTLTAKYAEAVVSGVKKELFRMPGGVKDSATIEVVLTDGVNEYNDLFNFSLHSSNPEVVDVQGMNLILVDEAEGKTTISVYCGDNIVHQFTVNAIDYEGLGYTAVSTREEFFAMSGSGKYVLTNNIDLDSKGLWDSAWQPLILVLEEDAVIDGAGHFVNNAWLLDGWNNGWIKEVKGTLRNIAFTNIKSGSPFPYEAALIGKVSTGGILENIYLHIEIQADGGPASEHKAAGAFVGTLEGGTIKDCLVNIFLKEGLESVNNVGALVSFAAFWGTENDGIFNSYAVVNNNLIPAFALEAAEGVFAYNLKSGGVTQTVYELLNTVDPDLFDETLWTFSNEGVRFNGELVMECEPELEIKVEKSLSLDLVEGPIYFDVSVYSYGSLINDYTITYSSDNPDVLTVSEEGIFTPVSVGTAKVTIVVEGVEAYCDVTVYSSEEATTYIYNAEQFRQLIEANPDGDFTLANDIDFHGGWLGGNATFLVDTFSGTLDGNGHQILNGWLPGGWNNGLFKKNTGVIKNIAFVNVYGTSVVADTALIGINYGTIENVYLDFIVYSSPDHGGVGGTLAGFDDGGTIKNCVVNVRLDVEQDCPPFYGSIVGKIMSWQTKIENSFSIVNGLAINDIAFAEAAEGIIEYVKTSFNSEQFTDYASFFAGADLTSFDNLWEFTSSGISFGSVIVLSY